MLSNWNSALAQKVAQCIENLLKGGQADCRMAIAYETSALPVYMDMSGCILLTTDGEVVFYDSDRKLMRQVDSAWETIAIVSAIEAFPCLAELRPQMPPSATICPSCSGTGKVIRDDVYCGTCNGLGWLDQTK